MMQTENILNDSRLRALENHTRVNLLRPTLGTSTVNGVTCTANGDGTYTLNGTASGDCYFEIDGARSLWENKGLKYGKDYKFVGCPKGGSSTTYGLKLDGNTTIEWYDMGDGVVINYPTSLSSNIFNFCIYVKSGTTCNNLVFKPMLTTDLTATYDDFVSYEDSLVTGSSQYFFGGVDTSRVLAGGLAVSSGYTATEDCYILLQKNENTAERILAYVNGTLIMGFQTSNGVSDLFPLKAGQVITGENVWLTAYGVKR